MAFIKRAFEKRFWKSWELPEDMVAAIPEGDFRDQLPLPMEKVAAVYAPVVKDGEWTLGLCEMWGRRGKVAKHAVHMPCWDSCSINPCKWRGFILGRNPKECLYFGLHYSRWARGVYSAGLGREYTMHKKCCGRCFKSHSTHAEISSLATFACTLGILLKFGLTFGLAFIDCVHLISFEACYTCHSREKLRRKYNIPATFCCLPPGIDDWVVHCFCMYCASHQELRELAVRGVDGEGIYVLDMTPQSYEHNEGFKEAMEARKNKLALLKYQAPTFLPTEQRLRQEPGKAQQIISSAIHSVAPGGTASRASKASKGSKASKVDSQDLVNVESVVMSEMDAQVSPKDSKPAVVEMGATQQQVHSSSSGTSRSSTGPAVPAPVTAAPSSQAVSRD